MHIHPLQGSPWEDETTSKLPNTEFKRLKKLLLKTKSTFVIKHFSWVFQCRVTSTSVVIVIFLLCHISLEFVCVFFIPDSMYISARLHLKAKSHLDKLWIQNTVIASELYHRWMLLFQNGWVAPPLLEAGPSPMSVSHSGRHEYFHRNHNSHFLHRNILGCVLSGKEKLYYSLLEKPTEQWQLWFSL